MSSLKQAKSKLRSKDEHKKLSQLLKDSPKAKKRAIEIESFDSDVEYSIGEHVTKKKAETVKPAIENESFDVDELIEDIEEYDNKKKAETSGNHLQARKQIEEGLHMRFLNILSQCEATCKAMEVNEQQMKHFMKTCYPVATSDFKHKLEVLKAIHASFQKKCAKMELDHKIETEKLLDQLKFGRTMQGQAITEDKVYFMPILICACVVALIVLYFNV